MRRKCNGWDFPVQCGAKQKKQPNKCDLHKDQNLEVTNILIKWPYVPGLNPPFWELFTFTGPATISFTSFMPNDTFEMKTSDCLAARSKYALWPGFTEKVGNFHE